MMQLRDVEVTEAAWNLKENQKEYGSMDRDLKSKLHDKILRCSKNHLNGPTAKVCWKCGEDLTLPHIKVWKDGAWHIEIAPKRES